VRTKAKRAAELAEALAERVQGDENTVPADGADADERRQRLASLGYVSGSGAEAEGTLDPKDGVGLLKDLEKARRAVQLGDPNDALDPLQQLLARNPTNIPARLVLGQAQLATGRTEDAIATYRAVAGLAPRNALAWFDLGNAYAGRGAKDDAAYAESRRCYERSLELSPRHADTYLNLASLQASRHGPEEARKTFLRARAAGIADPTIETALGVLEVGRKDGVAAQAAFTRALVLNPRQPEALEAMGRLAYTAGDYARAAGFYERVLEANPTSATAKTLGAIRLYQLNDRPAALAAFTRALALTSPSDPDVADLKALVDELRR
jgi:Flp pilus assembly protein TadD